jgi:hypothetical protein
MDGESDDVAFDWLLIHLGIHSNPPNGRVHRQSTKPLPL